MSQHDVLMILKKNKRWMTSKEISEERGLNRGTVSINLTRLIHNKFVEKKMKKWNEYEYRWFDAKRNRPNQKHRS